MKPDSDNTPQPIRRSHYTDTLRRDPWRVVNRSVHQLGVRTIHVDEIESPDESRRLTWTYFPGRHAVIVLALDDEDNLLLVREYRHPLGREIFNLPAGAAEGGGTEEDLLADAARELAEETCLTAQTWAKIGSFYLLPATTGTLFHLYLAKDLTPLTERGTGDAWCEIEEVARIPFQELYASAVAGEVEDGMTVMALLWAVAAGHVQPQHEPINFKERS
jgi:8-oxo-dGTP pyrophosphatase MutT (NUDIX family)